MMAYQAHHYDTAPAIQKQLKRRRFMLAVVAVCVALLLAMGLEELRWIGLSVFVVLVAVILFFDRKSCRRQWLKQVRAQVDVPENAGNYRPRTMVFEDDKVIVTTDVANSTLLWRAFTAAEQTPDYIFLSLSAQQAYIIPKRVMTDAQVEELTQLLNNKIKR